MLFFINGTVPCVPYYHDLLRVSLIGATFLLDCIGISTPSYSFYSANITFVSKWFASVTFIPFFVVPDNVSVVLGSDWHLSFRCDVLLVEIGRGTQNPGGLTEGYGRVGVRVRIFIPPIDPYPSGGYKGTLHNNI